MTASQSRLFTALALACTAGAASAQHVPDPNASLPFVVPTVETFGWDRTMTGSTFGLWFEFVDPAGPNPAQASGAIGTLPTGAPAFDAFDDNAAESGTFITSTNNIYSPSGVNMPFTSSPGFDLGYGYKTTILYQVRTLGTSPDVESFLANRRYFPLEIVEVGFGDSGSQFGGFRIDLCVTFSIGRNDLEQSVFFSGLGTSMSYDLGIIDTFVELHDCPPDLHADEALDYYDILFFLDDVEADDADWNVDDVTDVNDLTAYLAAFDARCDL